MNDFFEELFVVLVIYKMKIEESPAYRSLTDALTASSNSTSLFIYDNSPAAQDLPTNSKWVCHYIHDASNPGVSKAYNEGYKKANTESKKWMLLVDQDSVFPVTVFDEYQKTLNQFRVQVVAPILKDQFGIVSPFKFRRGGGVRVTQLTQLGELQLNDFCLINSGLLISIQCFEETGGYDPQFQLDFSDIDFLFRLRKSQNIFALANLECQHELTKFSSRPESLMRFKNYIRASRAFKKKYPLLFWPPLRVFAQAIKFSLRSRDFGYMIAYFR